MPEKELVWFGMAPKGSYRAVIASSELDLVTRCGGVFECDVSHDDDCPIPTAPCACDAEIKVWRLLRSAG